MSRVRLASRLLPYFLIAAGALTPAIAPAQTTQERLFFETLYAACQTTQDPNFDLFCSNTFTGGLAGGVYTPGAGTSNVGSTGSYGGSGQTAVQRQREIDEEDKKKRKKSGEGSGDSNAGPFGGFVTAQMSRTNRALTNLENGYKAELAGFLIGLDRRFGNDLVAGATVGRSNTDSNYMNAAGSIDARNTTLMLYTTYLPAPGAYAGAYLGGGQGTQEATRRIEVGLITGLATSSTDSRQMLAGLSGGYDWYSGALTVSVTGAADYVRTLTKETTETGTTGFEFIYPEQTTNSLTSTLGMRTSYRQSFTWGAVAPAIRAAYVHEFRDDARTTSPRLVISPSTVFAFNTDSPDRNYYLGGAGVTVETGQGTQIFVDYEKRGGHAFIDTWSASIGLISEF